MITDTAMNYNNFSEEDADLLALQKANSLSAEQQNNQALEHMFKTEHVMAKRNPYNSIKGRTQAGKSNSKSTNSTLDASSLASLASVEDISKIENKLDSLSIELARVSNRTTEIKDKTEFLGDSITDASHQSFAKAFEIIESNLVAKDTRLERMENAILQLCTGVKSLFTAINDISCDVKQINSVEHGQGNRPYILDKRTIEDMKAMKAQLEDGESKNIVFDQDKVAHVLLRQDSLSENNIDDSSLIENLTRRNRRISPVSFNLNNKAALMAG